VRDKKQSMKYVFKINKESKAENFSPIGAALGVYRPVWLKFLLSVLCIILRIFGSEHFFISHC
jgi:hypothetical protein